jgi:glucose/mannose-6-phosphate isomerase
MKMHDLVERFTSQLEEALEIGKKAVINKPKGSIRNVYVSGLGGSGIGGNFAQEFIRNEAKIPYVVGKSYDIPKWVGKNTLAIASSYSGNTEETLAAFDDMLKTGAKIICVSSGGKLIELAKKHGLDYIQVPSNWPSPRACLGYSVVMQLTILNKLRLISAKSLKQMASSIALLKREETDIKKRAMKVAGQLENKIPIIYTTDRMESVAVRFRQQVNENAKMLCWHHVVPEMNHNELVGWKMPNEDLAVVYFRNKDDYERNAVRIEINKTIIKKCTGNIIELHSKGRNLIERAMYFVHLGDWISCYLADLRNEDSIEVKAIDFLKGELGKI